MLASIIQFMQTTYYQNKMYSLLMQESILTPTPGRGGDSREIEGIWDLHHAQGGGALELFRSVSDLGGGRSGA